MVDPADKGLMPDYDCPPVVETILGVQFDRLPGFGNAHLGAFWKTLDNDEWPIVVDAPPLAPQYERFTDAARWAKGVQLQLTQDPACRLQIKNNDGDRMIQLQNTRLHFNWLGEAGGGYPRYKKVREGFVRTLDRFVEFVAAEKLGNFRPNQWEVIYLNHIPKGSVWKTPDEWDFFLPLRSVPNIESVVHGESFSGEWHFVIPDQRGRLHVRWQHGSKLESEQQEMIVLTFTARGSITTGENASNEIINGLNLGRKTIVCSFKNFMSKEANRHWGLKHGSD